MKRTLILAVVLVLTASAAAQAAMIVDRGLPGSDLNNAAGTSRSNVSWAFVEKDQFVGDDFTLPGSAPSWRVDTIRTWFVGFDAIHDADLTNDEFLGDWYKDVSLYVGPVGSSLNRVSLGNFVSGSDSTSNPDVVATRVQYNSGIGTEIDYQGNSGGYYTIVQIDFGNLNLNYLAGTKLQFGVHATGITGDGDDTFDIAFMHASNAALSGTTQEQADNLYRWFQQDASPATATFQGILDSNGSGWDKSSDINVQVEATPTPEPTTFLLWGTTAVGLAAVRRWRTRRAA